MNNSQKSKQYEISKIENGLIFYTRYTGPLSLEMLFKSSYERTSDPDYENAVFVIIDILGADIAGFSPDDVRTMSQRVKEVLLERPHMVVIIIAKDELSYGLSRIWRGTTRPVSKDLHVVLSKEEAFKIVDKKRKERQI